MDNINQKCKECGEKLKLPEYARIKREGETATKDKENLVCGNPECPKSIKIV